MSRKEPEEFNKKKRFGKIKYFFRKKISYWAALLFFIIEFEIIVFFTLYYSLFPPQLPAHIGRFNISQVIVERTDIRNLAPRNIIAENDYLEFKFHFKNEEKFPATLYYNYMIRNAMDKGSWPNESLVAFHGLEPNNGTNSVLFVPFSKSGFNILDFYFELYNSSTKILQTTYEWYFDVYLIEQTRDMDYKRIAAIGVLIAIIPATVIAFNNLEEFFSRIERKTYGVDKL